MSQDIQVLYDLVDKYTDLMISSLRESLQIPSKKEAPTGDGSPFGAPIRKALDHTLSVCRQIGFTVKDVDGYAGHAEFGNGKECVAAIGHLDVVPEGGGWTKPPYGAVMENGYIYARGSSDDKGPLYSAIFAAKALMDSGLPLKRRIRVIFGCDEESGFGCVEYYWNKANEERPVLAFSPDAEFPLIYAEKGISNISLQRDLPNQASGLRVVSARGGERPNMVPDYAEATITGGPADLYEAVIKLNHFWDANMRYELEPDSIKVVLKGKSAHGSTPESGENAVSRLMKALLTLNLSDDKPWIQATLDAAEIAGRKLGLDGCDEVSGELTSNLGVMETKDGKVYLTINIRYPVTLDFKEKMQESAPTIERLGWSVAQYTDSPPLYVPLDKEPVKTLLEVYREETGDFESKPITMGGGTYARATPRAVAFGPHFPGCEDGPAHEKDERISVANLVRAAKIYAHALYKLANTEMEE